MIVLIRELANITLSITTKALSTNLKAKIIANMDIDNNVNFPSGRLASSNSNSSRESSMYSNASFVPYYIRMKIQSNNSL